MNKRVKRFIHIINELWHLGYDFGTPEKWRLVANRFRAGTPIAGLCNEAFRVGIGDAYRAMDYFSRAVYSDGRKMGGPDGDYWWPLEWAFNLKRAAVALDIAKAMEIANEQKRKQ
jgi:hypothetical protein